MKSRERWIPVYTGTQNREQKCVDCVPANAGIQDETITRKDGSRSTTGRRESAGTQKGESKTCESQTLTQDCESLTFTTPNFCVPAKAGIQIFVFFFLILSLFYFPSQTSAATLSKPTNTIGLVGWWTFDGGDMTPNVRDRSGNGNHGNLSGQTSTTTVNGKIGQALVFDGVDDAVNAGSATSLDEIQNQGGGGMTISAWIKPSGGGTIISKDRTNLGSFFLDLQSSGRISFNKDGTSDMQARTTTSSWLTGVWQHLVVVWSGDTTASNVGIYVDGVEKTHDLNSNGSSFRSDDTHSLYLGNAVSNGGPYSGLMDDVRLYNRQLSLTEIRGIYNASVAKISATKSPGTLSNGLVGHWTFDGANMTPNVRDVSGQAKHGNLSGQTSTTTINGKLGQALLFDGTNDKVVTSFLPSSVTNVTVNFWAQPNTWGSFYTSVNSGATRFYLKGSSATQLQLGLSSWNPFIDAAMVLGEWQMYTIILDGTNGYIYRNGSLIDSATGITVSLPSSSLDFAWDKNVAYYKGYLDDFRVYNRAISTQEIQQLYAMGGSKANTSTNVTKGTLDTGLVGLWSFDGKDLTDKVYDRSGNGNNGYFIGGATSTAKINGKLGQALNFDGTDDYVSLLNDSYNSHTTGSMSAWMNFRTKPSSGNAVTIFGGGSSSNSSGLFSFSVYSPSPGDTRLRVGANMNADYVYGDTSLETNRWYFVTATSDGALTRLYVDGVLQTLSIQTGSNTGKWMNSSVSGTMRWTVANLRRSSGDIGHFNGSIDDMRVYSKVLSASEIKQLYNMGR